MQNHSSEARVPLQMAAHKLGLTGHGLLKILKRTDTAIRFDGRWYVHQETLVSIDAARRTLGISRPPKAPSSTPFKPQGHRPATTTS